MRSDSLIIIVAILAAVGIVQLVMQDQPSNEAQLAWPNSTPTGMYASRYSQADLKRFPRPPIPRNDPASWLSSEDWPSSALAQDFEGDVRFRLEVDPFGEVTDCEVNRSSGVRALDIRACAAVSTRARFYAALDEHQQSVVGVYEAQVPWFTSEASSPLVMRLSIDVAPNGEVTACDMLKEGRWQEVPAWPLCRYLAKPKNSQMGAEGRPRQLSIALNKDELLEITRRDDASERVKEIAAQMVAQQPTREELTARSEDP